MQAAPIPNILLGLARLVGRAWLLGLLMLLAVPIALAAQVPSIVEASSNKLSIKTKAASVDWAFTLRNDARAQVRLFVDVTPLVTPDGRSIPLAILDATGKPLKSAVTLPPLGHAQLRLKADLKHDNKGAPTGSYVGSIGLITDKRTPIAVEIAFSRAVLGVKVDPVTQLSAEVARESTVLNLHLHETEGIERNLPAPTIVFLDRKVGDGQVGATFDAAQSKPAETQIKISADGDTNVQFPIRDVADPGKYEGKIRFTAPDRLPVDVAFTFSARYAMWVPIMLIGLGVIVASVIRFFLTVLRPRLTVQRDGIILRDRIIEFRERAMKNDSGLRPDEAGLIETLLGQVDNVLNGTGNASQQSLLVKVGEKAQLLGPWMRVNRLADGEAVTDEMRGQLFEIGAALAGDGDWDLAARRTALGDLEREMRTAIRGKILGGITALQARLDLPPKAITQLDNAEKAIAKADFTSAQQLLNQARRTVANVILATLHAQIAVNAPAPPGISATDWRLIITRLSPQIDRAERMADALVLDAIKRVQKEYLDEAIRGLEGLTKGVADAAIALPVSNARTAMDAGDVDAARSNYEMGLSAYQNSLAGSRGGAPVMPKSLGTMAAMTAALEPDGKWTDQFVPSVLPLSKSLKAAQKSLIWIEVLTSAVLGIIAIVIGLAFLYIDNDDWGSVGDIFAAFVWGLGLNQFAGTQFQSIADLRKQYSEA